MASPQNWKEHVLALNEMEFMELKNVYEYHFTRRRIRSTGILNICLGLLTIALASGGETSLITTIATILGILIVAVSVWAALIPSKAGFAAYSLLFLLTGLWNIFLAVLRTGQDLSLIIAALGILQLWWAYRYFAFYLRVASIPIHRPSERFSSLSDGIWDSISRDRLAKDNDVIEFETGRFRWRGWLFDTRAAFATSTGKTVIFDVKQDVTISPHGKVVSSSVRAAFTFNKMHWSGTIDSESLKRFTAWKTDDKLLSGEHNI